MKVFRFAPSPTGRLHLGSARTALISYILAKKAGGKFHYRIEDTDKARSTPEFEKNLTESMKWLGIDYEPTVIRQSEQEANGVYKNIADMLVANGLAYYCQCSTSDLKAMKAAQIVTKRTLGYEGVCRERGHTEGVLRLNYGALRMFLEPNEYGGVKDLRFTDSVYGSRHVDIRDLRDTVLLRADGTATYIMANTVDDVLTGVTDIVRGADLLPQTATQILLRRALARVLGRGIKDPQYTHLPLVLNEDGEKLSKRDPSTKSILELRDAGILPQAIIQFVLSVGNNSIARDRAMSLDEIIESFDPSQNAKNNVAFSYHQLLHINKLHLRALPASQISTDFPEKLINACKMRHKTLNDVLADAAKSYNIIMEHRNSLVSLAQEGFSPESCQVFRAQCVGESSMGFDKLYEIAEGS